MKFKIYLNIILLSFVMVASLQASSDLEKTVPKTPPNLPAADYQKGSFFIEVGGLYSKYEFEKITYEGFGGGINFTSRFTTPLTGMLGWNISLGFIRLEDKENTFGLKEFQSNINIFPSSANLAKSIGNLMIAAGIIYTYIDTRINYSISYPFTGFYPYKSADNYMLRVYGDIYGGTTSIRYTVNIADNIALLPFISCVYTKIGMNTSNEIKSRTIASGGDIQVNNSKPSSKSINNSAASIQTGFDIMIYGISVGALADFINNYDNKSLNIKVSYTF